LKAVVSDANILIDYIKSNKYILSLSCERLFKIIVPSPILKEIKQLSAEEAVSLGLEVYEPTFKQVTEAIKRENKLSFQDKLCFIIARDKNCICATNDKVLRNYCKNNNVEIVWGLEIMIKLCENDYLDKKTAVETAKEINKINKLITKEVVEVFIDKINKL